MGRQIDHTQNDIFASARGINRQIYLDSLLSPQFFSNSFKRTFGTITYYLEKIGMYFACFLCLKFVTDIVVAIVGAFEPHTISNKTLGFWKIMLGATYNLFNLSLFTAVFSNEERRSAPIMQNAIEDNYHTYSTIENQHECTNKPIVEENKKEENQMYPQLQNANNQNQILPL